MYKRQVPAESPFITCQCIRVPVLNGHTAAVFVKFKKNPTKEQLIEALEKFSGVPQDLGLPSAPKQFISCLLYTSLKDIKLGFKLLRYGYKLKLNVIMFVFLSLIHI